MVYLECDVQELRALDLGEVRQEEVSRVGHAGLETSVRHLCRLLVLRHYAPCSMHNEYGSLSPVEV